MKLKDRLAKLQKASPNCSKNGQLYKEVSETKYAYSRVKLFTLFRSEENTLMLRPHVFIKKKPMLPAEWSAWFGEHLKEIQRLAVLPGLGVRTSKSWGVQRVIGWVGDAKYKSRNTAMDSRRDKAKRKRGKNG